MSVKSDFSEKGSAKYLRSLSFRNMWDLGSLENCFEICAY